MRRYQTNSFVANARQDITGTGANIKLTRAMEILAGTPDLVKYWRKEDSGDNDDDDDDDDQQDVACISFFFSLPFIPCSYTRRVTAHFIYLFIFLSSIRKIFVFLPPPPIFFIPLG